MIEYPAEVVAFHGTSVDVLPRLLGGDFVVSENPYDWLGDGLYFFQDSPWRARDWAVGRYGSDAAVLAARISIDGCLDLLNPEWQAVLRQADAQFVAECMEENLPIPANRGGNRARDRATINWYAGLNPDPPIRSVRAVFEEGDYIFEASAIRTHSHLQLAVRDVTTIFEVEEVEIE